MSQAEQHGQVSENYDRLLAEVVELRARERQLILQKNSIDEDLAALRAALRSVKAEFLRAQKQFDRLLKAS